MGQDMFYIDFKGLVMMGFCRFYFFYFYFGRSHP